MMKVATGEGSPSGKVPKWAPDWFFVATEAYGGGTSDLGFFSGVSVFIGIFSIGNKSREFPRSPQARGRALGGRPPPLWLPRDSSGPTPMLRGLLLVHKESP